MQCKSEVTGIYRKGDPILPARQYFVSEVFPFHISTEWRVFVYKGEVQDIRRYVGNPYFGPPKKEFVEDAIQVYGEKAPPAYTLDVAILENGCYAVIEVHPFIR